MTRIDPDWHQNLDLTQFEETDEERRDNELFNDIVAAIVIITATILIVAPLFVAYWLTSHPPINHVIPVMAEDDCPYFHEGKPLKDVSRVNAGSSSTHLECRY